MDHDIEKKYLEYFAKVLLETLFPDQYAGLNKYECPDLRMGEKRGIEVTRAMFVNQGQANRILDRIHGKTREQIDPRYINTMDKIQTKILTKPDGTICGYVSQKCKNEAGYNEILDAYRKKKIKPYKTVHTDLFIYPPMAQIDDWIGKEQIEECFNIMSNDPDNPFGHLILYEEPSLYIFDVTQKKMEYRRATSAEITTCKEKADAYSGWSSRVPN